MTTRTPATHQMTIIQYGMSVSIDGMKITKTVKYDHQCKYKNNTRPWFVPFRTGEIRKDNENQFIAMETICYYLIP